LINDQEHNLSIILILKMITHILGFSSFNLISSVICWSRFDSVIPVFLRIEQNATTFKICSCFSKIKQNPSYFPIRGLPIHREVR